MIVRACLAGQRCQEADKELSVCVVEKAAEVGTYVHAWSHAAQLQPPHTQQPRTRRGARVVLRTTHAVQARTSCRGTCWSPARCTSCCQAGRRRVRRSTCPPPRTGACPLARDASQKEIPAGSQGCLSKGDACRISDYNGTNDNSQ